MPEAKVEGPLPEPKRATEEIVDMKAKIDVVPQPEEVKVPPPKPQQAKEKILVMPETKKVSEIYVVPQPEEVEVPQPKPQQVREKIEMPETRQDNGYKTS